MSPQRFLVNIGGLALGLFIGFALAGLLEFLDSTYRSDADVIGALALPVLAVVPNVPTAGELKVAARRTRMVAATVAGIVVVSAGATVALQLWRYIL